MAADIPLVKKGQCCYKGKASHVTRELDLGIMIVVMTMIIEHRPYN